MATYAIGDIQGCAEALHRLLDQIKFDQTQDHLWFVGDLVNRGPQSLEVLRFVKQLGTSATTVLGNHDLHLLALWAGITKPNRKDTLQNVLSAPDSDELLHWLRCQPLIHAEEGYVMVHAGLLPSWSLEQTLELAHEVEKVLQGQEFQKFLPEIYFRKTQRPSSNLNDEERLSLTSNVLTRLRICSNAPHQKSLTTAVLAPSTTMSKKSSVANNPSSTRIRTAWTSAAKVTRARKKRSR